MENNMFRDICRWLFGPDLQIGKKYINSEEVDAFYPLLCIPKKLNKTRVLYDVYDTRRNSIINERESSIKAFKICYTLYE